MGQTEGQTWSPLDFVIRLAQRGASSLIRLGQWRLAFGLLDAVPGRPSSCWPVGAELAAMRAEEPTPVLEEPSEPAWEYVRMSPPLIRLIEQQGRARFNGWVSGQREPDGSWVLHFERLVEP